MIEKYYKLDVTQFYREFNGNKKLLESLREEKRQAAHSGGFDYSQPHAAAGPGDPTTQKVFQRMSIDRRIHEVEEYFRLEKNIREYLDDEELQIVEYLKQGKGTRQIAELLHLSESQTGVKVARCKRHIQELTMWQTEKSGD